MIPAAAAVPVLSVTSIFLNLLVYLRARRSLDLKWIVPLLVSGVAGIPAGIWLLRTADESLLKAVIGAVVTLSALVFLFGARLRVRRERLVMIPVGLLSGVLNGCTTFSGPPVILFFANQNVAKHRFRAGLAAYFLILNIVAVPAFAAGGVLTLETAGNAALLFPGVVAGSLLGIHLAGRVPQETFRRIALTALALLGTVSMLTAL